MDVSKWASGVTLRVTIPRPPTLEPETAESLARKHFRSVLGFCRSLLGPGADAEDAAQGVFLTVARRSTEIPGVRRPLPWLLQIARYACLNLRRERDRLRADPVAPDDAAEAGAPVDPGENLDRVRDAATRLPERYRAVLDLHYRQGLSQAEIAEALELSPGALRVLLHRAVARLRQHVRDAR
jgi:RNA polymerase sigma-70 factor (ECF subfamily)